MMEELYKEMLAIIKQTPHLKERIYLVNTPQGARRLFLMACYFDDYHAVKRNGLYGKLNDEIEEGFFVFMKGGN